MHSEVWQQRARGARAVPPAYCEVIKITLELNYTFFVCLVN
jgi:hypothetical protein